MLRVLATNDLGAALVPVTTTWGESGTCAGVAELLERERSRQPAIWLDAGDLGVGAAHALAGDARWDDVARLPIAASAAGNHEFDDGLEAMHGAVARLPFPLLCANADAGLPASALIETDAGPLGAIGLTNPWTHLHAAHGPQPARDWHVPELAAQLRANGARWVVALLHDGATWWPHGDGIATRTDRLERVASPWAGAVDLILGGHTLGAWTGALGGTPAGHGHPFAASVLVADLPAPGHAEVRGVMCAPPVRPQPSAAVEALDRAAADVVAHSEETWLVRTGDKRYLLDLIAHALHAATGADAGFAPSFQSAGQAPLDGAVAALRAGPVTRLDLHRLLVDAELVVGELRPGELRTLTERHDATTAPDNRAGDDVWWAWCRVRAGVSAAAAEPSSVALLPWVAERVADWLGRDLALQRAGVTAHAAMIRALATPPDRARARL